MKRYEFVFKEWCDRAASEIKYPPDSKKVRQELHDHMMDHFEAMLAKGVPEDVATNKTLEAMGSAKELAPQLAAVHHPVWTAVLLTCKRLLIILLILCVIPIYRFLPELNPLESGSFWGYDVFDPSSYGGDTGRTLLHLSEHNDVRHSDGNNFKLTDAAVFTETSDADSTQATTYLFFRMRQGSLLPWAEQEEYMSYINIFDWFTVRDDQGNEYYVVAWDVQNGIFSGTYECLAPNFSPDAQWAEICYERDGRDLSWYIDLTGGD